MVSLIVMACFNGVSLSNCLNSSRTGIAAPVEPYGAPGVAA